MDKLVHFAKVFGITWAIITGLWVVSVFRGWDFSVGWVGQSHPPKWLPQLLFYAWPVVPAFLIASLLRLTRLAMFRRH